MFKNIIPRYLILELAQFLQSNHWRILLGGYSTGTLLTPFSLGGTFAFFLIRLLTSLISGTEYTFSFRKYFLSTYLSCGGHVIGAAHLMIKSASCPRGESPMWFKSLQDGHQTALEMGKGGVSKASRKRQEIRWKSK